MSALPPACILCGHQTTHRTRIDEPLATSAQALLLTNDPPLDAERETLRITRRDALSGIAELERRIQSASQFLADLMDEKRGAENQLGQLETILNPIRILPSEILQEIMLNALAPTHNAFHTRYLLPGRNIPSSIEPAFPSWTLSQISRTWRRCALNHAKIWSSIILDFGRPSYGLVSPRVITFKVALMLGRSKDLDLSILLALDEDHPVLGVLEAAAARWKTFRVLAPAPVVQSLDGLEFPRLKKLAISHLTGTGETTTTFQSACPQLEFYTVWKAFVQPAHIPWRSLKRLSFSNARFPQGNALIVLQSLTSLVHLHMHTCRAATTSAYPRSCLTLPSLKILILETDDSNHASFIPQIVSLFADQVIDVLDIKFPLHCAAKFPASGSHLRPKSIKIQCDYGFQTNTSTVCDFLVLTESAERLRISGCVDDILGLKEEIIILLAIQERNDAFRILPELKMIAFGSPLLCEEYPEAFLDMADARFNQCPAFEVLHIKGGRLEPTFSNASHAARWNSFVAKRYNSPGAL